MNRPVAPEMENKNHKKNIKVQVDQLSATGFGPSSFGGRVAGLCPGLIY